MRMEKLCPRKRQCFWLAKNSIMIIKRWLSSTCYNFVQFVVSGASNQLFVLAQVPPLHLFKASTASKLNVCSCCSHELLWITLLKEHRHYQTLVVFLIGFLHQTNKECFQPFSFFSASLNVSYNAAHVVFFRLFLSFGCKCFQRTFNPGGSLLKALSHCAAAIFCRLQTEFGRMFPKSSETLGEKLLEFKFSLISCSNYKCLQKWAKAEQCHRFVDGIYVWVDALKQFVQF